MLYMLVQDDVCDTFLITDSDRSAVVTDDDVSGMVCVVGTICCLFYSDVHVLESPC